VLWDPKMHCNMCFAEFGGKVNNTHETH